MSESGHSVRLESRREDDHGHFPESGSGDGRRLLAMREHTRDGQSLGRDTLYGGFGHAAISAFASARWQTGRSGLAEYSAHVHTCLGTRGWPGSGCSRFHQPAVDPPLGRAAGQSRLGVGRQNSKVGQRRAKFAWEPQRIRPFPPPLGLGRVCISLAKFTQHGIGSNRPKLGRHRPTCRPKPRRSWPRARSACG